VEKDEERERNFVGYLFKAITVGALGYYPCMNFGQSHWKRVHFQISLEVKENSTNLHFSPDAGGTYELPCLIFQ
jgi:hypothetical protein